MSSEKAPALMKLRETLEHIRDRVEPSKRKGWQRFIDMLDMGADQMDTIIEQLQAENYSLKNQLHHGMGEYWEDILWGYVEDEDEDDDDEEDNSDETDA